MKKSKPSQQQQQTTTPASCYKTEFIRLNEFFWKQMMNNYKVIQAVVLMKVFCPQALHWIQSSCLLSSTKLNYNWHRQNGVISWYFQCLWWCIVLISPKSQVDCWSRSSLNLLEGQQCSHQLLEGHLTCLILYLCA